MEIAVQKADKITDMKNRMSDIYLSVSWREISRTYFEKSEKIKMNRKKKKRKRQKKKKKKNKEKND